MLNTYIYQSFPASDKFGNTIVCTASDKQSAQEEIASFLASKGLKQQVNSNDIWQLNTEVPQVTFICGK